jgi:hypothetical protein
MIFTTTSLMYHFPFYFAGQYLTLIPQSPASVREGHALVLTCQSNHTNGFYHFFYVNGDGSRVNYAVGEEGSCQSFTNDTVVECDFGTSWTFKLTLLNPVHDQTVYCERNYAKNSSTTIFVQGSLQIVNHIHRTSCRSNNKTTVYILIAIRFAVMSFQWSEIQKENYRYTINF